MAGAAGTCCSGTTTTSCTGTGTKPPPRLGEEVADLFPDDVAPEKELGEVAAEKLEGDVAALDIRPPPFCCCTVFAVFPSCTGTGTRITPIGPWSWFWAGAKMGSLGSLLSK